MQVKLLLAVQDDKAEVWGMFVPAMKPYIEKIWGWELEWQTNEFNSRFLELNTSFIFSGDEKSGYVQYSLNEEDTYLNMVILEPECQGKELGSKVVNLVQGLQSNKPLRLRCFHINNRATRFYERNGFTTIESEENFVLLERTT